MQSRIVSQQLPTLPIRQSHIRIIQKRRQIILRSPRPQSLIINQPRLPIPHNHILRLKIPVHHSPRQRRQRPPYLRQPFPQPNFLQLLSRQHRKPRRKLPEKIVLLPLVQPFIKRRLQFPAHQPITQRLRLNRMNLRRLPQRAPVQRPALPIPLPPFPQIITPQILQPRTPPLPIMRINPRHPQSSPGQYLRRRKKTQVVRPVRRVHHQDRRLRPALTPHPSQPVIPPVRPALLNRRNLRQRTTPPGYHLTAFLTE